MEASHDLYDLYTEPSNSTHEGSIQQSGGANPTSSADIS